MRPRASAALGALAVTAASLAGLGAVSAQAVPRDAPKGSVTGQQIAERVAAAGDGTVRFAYDLKPGVEICDRAVHSWSGDRTWHVGGRHDRGRCLTDVAEVDVEVRAGVVRGVEVVRPSEAGSDDLRADLGLVSPQAAVDFLLGLARSGATARAAEDAVFPATIAHVEGTWRGLLDLAGEPSVHPGVRKNALFWVGQEAAEAATEGLSEVALADEEEQEVREAAIFALSQRPANQAITSLIEIARSAEQAESRRTAMFWLAQSEDERVVDFFEEVLLGRNR